MSGAQIRKGYCDGPHGQIHWRMVGDAGPEPDLYCLHPAPFSGLAFTNIMPHLAKGRRVIAPDFPGHGGSHNFHDTPQIADYAEAIQHVAARLSSGKPVDLLGFHTGCLVACEIALAMPGLVRKLVLVDVPAFEADTRREHLQSSSAPPQFTAELESLSSAWERGITRRIESQGMARSFEMFVEQLRHGEAMNAGFHAGFSYEVEERLPLVTHPTTIIATQSMLHSVTCQAARMIRGAKLIERTDVTRAVLDEAAETIAAEVLDALD